MDIPPQSGTRNLRQCREQRVGRHPKTGPLLQVPNLVFSESVGRGGVGGDETTTKQPNG